VKDMIPYRKAQGFTLIELVMVIVILGILAAFALPRFADLSGDAELATVQGAQGSVKSAMAIVRSKALATGEGTTTVASGGTGAPSLEGKSIALQNGYLDVGSIETAAQLDTNDFLVKAGSNTENAVITLASGEANDPCFVFTGSTGPNRPPTVSTVRSSYDGTKSAVADMCP